MSLNLFSRHALRSKKAPQGRILASNSPSNTLHLQCSLAIATLILTHASLKIIDQLALPSARAALVLTVESEGLWGSSLVLGKHYNFF
jgi:hypothetical protein